MPDSSQLSSLALIDVRDRSALRWLAPPPLWCSSQSPEQLLELLRLPESLLVPGPPGRFSFDVPGFEVLAVRDTSHHCLLIRPASVAPEQARDEFFAAFSHQLRTPLNAIVGFSKLLQLGKGGDLNDRQREFIDHVVGAAEQLLAVVNQGLEQTRSRVNP